MAYASLGTRVLVLIQAPVVELYQWGGDAVKITTYVSQVSQ